MISVEEHAAACYNAHMDDLKKNEIYEAAMTGFTSEGAGVCRIKGRAVFVPRALPGETWRAVSYTHLTLPTILRV